ncbi:hypothetical protein KP509_1Z270300 [Ceratopteris richardii]|nr:hypothetical protein KP509_1Z270300 [Ceratopteris richardii]
MRQSYALITLLHNSFALSQTPALMLYSLLTLFSAVCPFRDDHFSVTCSMPERERLNSVTTRVNSTTRLNSTRCSLLPTQILYIVGLDLRAGRRLFTREDNSTYVQGPCHESKQKADVAVSTSRQKLH